MDSEADLVSVGNNNNNNTIVRWSVYTLTEIKLGFLKEAVFSSYITNIVLMEYACNRNIVNTFPKTSDIFDV